MSTPSKPHISNPTSQPYILNPNIPNLSSYSPPCQNRDQGQRRFAVVTTTPHLCASITARVASLGYLPQARVFVCVCVCVCVGVCVCARTHTQGCVGNACGGFVW